TVASTTLPSGDTLLPAGTKARTGGEARTWRIGTGTFAVEAGSKYCRAGHGACTLKDRSKCWRLHEAQADAGNGGAAPGRRHGSVRPDGGAGRLTGGGRGGAGVGPHRAAAR